MVAPSRLRDLPPLLALSMMPHEDVADISNGSGGGTQTGPAQTPGVLHGGQRSSTVSPAVPVVVVVACALAVLWFCWWFRRRLRQSRRYSPLLVRLGLAQSPELVEVCVQSAKIAVTLAEAQWASLSPLACTKRRGRSRSYPLPGPYTAALYPPSRRLTGQQTSRQARQPRKTTRASDKGPLPTMQVVVLIAMPSPHTEAQNKETKSGENHLPALHLGVADVKWTSQRWDA